VRIAEIIELPGCNRKKSDRTPLAFTKSKKKRSDHNGFFAESIPQVLFSPGGIPQEPAHPAGLPVARFDHTEDFRDPGAAGVFRPVLFQQGV